MAAKGLFFDGVLIGAEEAPNHILKAERFASSYYAVLKKRLGRIVADDFLKYARRFSVLCDKIYQGSNLDLRMNEVVILRPSTPPPELMFLHKGRGTSGKNINVDQLTADEFREIFAPCSSMVLTIKPLVERADIRYSFSKIEWTCARPKIIWLYSQDGGRCDGDGCHPGPLTDLLLRKMFYVPCVAPSLNFAVKLGVEADLDERHK